MKTLGWALVWCSCVTARGVGVRIVSMGAADAAKLTSGAGTGIMPLVAAGTLDGFRVVWDLAGVNYCS